MSGESFAAVCCCTFIKQSGLTFVMITLYKSVLLYYCCCDDYCLWFCYLCDV